jgi:hypothetical protein
MHIYGKVKVTLVQALRLCTDHTAHRGSRGIALPFHDHSTRRGWGVSVMPRPLFTPRKDPVPIVQEAGWAPGPVWMGVENLAPHQDMIPRLSSPSQSLYRLSYPAHNAHIYITVFSLYMKFNPTCFDTSVATSGSFKTRASLSCTKVVTIT